MYIGLWFLFRLESLAHNFFDVEASRQTKDINNPLNIAYVRYFIRCVFVLH